MNARLILIFTILIIPLHITPRGVEVETQDKAGEEITPIKAGNLKLLSSQCPGPLFSFGQNMFDKGDTLGFIFYSTLHGEHKEFNEIFLLGVHQFTDKFSLLCAVTAARKFKEDCACSSGIEDIGIQGEYSIFSKPTDTAYNFATVVGTVFLPTGSAKKNPPTGNGSSSFFAGLTMAHLSVEWYVFTSYGVTITTKHNGVKPGDQLLYQFGVGHNIPTGPKWISQFLVEFLGDFSADDVVDCVRDCESGSNFFSIAPSLWLSNERFIFQIGVSVPVIQHQSPLANKDKYTIAGGMGYKF